MVWLLELVWIIFLSLNLRSTKKFFRTIWILIVKGWESLPEDKRWYLAMYRLKCAKDMVQDAPDIYWPREALKVGITGRTMLFFALRAGFNAYVINLKKTLFICYVDVILWLKSLFCENFLICNRWCDILKWVSTLRIIEERVNGHESISTTLSGRKIQII